VELEEGERKGGRAGGPGWGKGAKAAGTRGGLLSWVPVGKSPQWPVAGFWARKENRAGQENSEKVHSAPEAQWTSINPFRIE